MAPKFRHIAIVCKDPAKLGEWYQKAFGLELVRFNPETGVTQLGDGEFNLTLLHEGFAKESPEPWHFGLQMPVEEIEARRAQLEELGATYHDGTRDGRPVEVYLRDPEGHRIDLAPRWPGKAGEKQREHDYRTWEKAPAART